MALIVQKFGGTSVGTIERIESRDLEGGRKTMGRTDRLPAHIIHQINHFKGKDGIVFDNQDPLARQIFIHNFTYLCDATRKCRKNA